VLGFLETTHFLGVLATPGQVGVQWELRGLSALRPPRGRPGENLMDSPFRIEYLDAERLLPVLARKAA
jgi:hypothetical protein